MTVSELKYLIAADEITVQEKGASIAAISKKMNVSKVSVYRGIERLVNKDYISRNNRKIVFTEQGKSALAEYRIIIQFIFKHLEQHCKVAADIAYNDALGVACSFSDESRKHIVEFVETLKGIQE